MTPMTPMNPINPMNPMNPTTSHYGATSPSPAYAASANEKRFFMDLFLGLFRAPDPDTSERTPLFGSSCLNVGLATRNWGSRALIWIRRWFGWLYSRSEIRRDSTPGGNGCKLQPPERAPSGALARVDSAGDMWLSAESDPSDCDSAELEFYGFPTSDSAYSVSINGSDDEQRCSSIFTFAYPLDDEAPDGGDVDVDDDDESEEDSDGADIYDSDLSAGARARALLRSLSSCTYPSTDCHPYYQSRNLARNDSSASSYYEVSFPEPIVIPRVRKTRVVTPHVTFDLGVTESEDESEAESDSEVFEPQLPLEMVVYLPPTEGEIFTDGWKAYFGPAVPEKEEEFWDDLDEFHTHRMSGESPNVEAEDAAGGAGGAQFEHDFAKEFKAKLAAEFLRTTFQVLQAVDGWDRSQYFVDEEAVENVYTDGYLAALTLLVPDHQYLLPWDKSSVPRTMFDPLSGLFSDEGDPGMCHIRPEAERTGGQKSRFCWA